MTGRREVEALGAARVDDVIELRDWPHTARPVFGTMREPIVRMKVAVLLNSPTHGPCAAGWTDEGADGHWTLWRILPLDRRVK